MDDSRRRLVVAAGVVGALAAVLAPRSDPRSVVPTGHDRPVPLLMYHVIARPVRGAPFPDLHVSRARFTREVAWLAAHGYHAVTLQQVFDYWHGGSRLPAHPVVLSFDDGYRSQYANALPVLLTHSWPGVLDLEVRNLDHVWGLSPGRVRALVADGWELDSHTITHPDLTSVDATRLREEVAGSRRWLRHEFHVPVDFFCYPSGRYDVRVLAAVRAAGYSGATTTRYGLALPSEPFTLRRVRVNGSDDVARFAAKLRALHV